ncbi:hypothetical protein J6590_030722 [Homalodisca vitripennis]|nr:hypothetical protein J6590_030721 [Homalodisca vitripennis]KAG8263566.1 hypothetical protein J6590_030722 [Homalodisca vitripennis]
MVTSLRGLIRSYQPKDTSDPRSAVQSCRSIYPVKSSQEFCRVFYIPVSTSVSSVGIRLSRHQQIEKTHGL